MAPLSGHGGLVSLQNGYALNVRNWSCNRDANLIEVTDFDSGGNREYIVGLKGAEFSFEAIMEASTTVNDVAEQGTATFMFDGSTGTEYLMGEIITGNLAATVNVDGEITLAYTANLTGALTIG